VVLVSRGAHISCSVDVRDLIWRVGAVGHGGSRDDAGHLVGNEFLPYLEAAQRPRCLASILATTSAAVRRRCRGARSEIGALDAGAATRWVRGSPPSPRRTPQALPSPLPPRQLPVPGIPSSVTPGKVWPDPHRRLASDGGDHLKKWVRARGSRTPSTSMSIFSL
jgi:hypothetical protein